MLEVLWIKLLLFELFANLAKLSNDFLFIFFHRYVLFLHFTVLSLQNADLLGIFI